MTTRTPKRQPSTPIRRKQMARALACAVFHGKRVAAKRFDTSTTTLTAWEKKLDTDPELRVDFEAQVALLDEVWLGDAKVLYRDALRRARALLETTERLRDVIPILRDLGPMLVEREALVGPEDHSAGPPDEEDSPEAARGPATLN